jgi:hypothetical protein
MKSLAILRIVAGLSLAAAAWSKGEIVKLTVTGGDPGRSVDITDKALIGKVDVFSGPGNFTMRDGVSVPHERDGSILFSQGVVQDPAKGKREYEFAVTMRLSEGDRTMCVLLYRYDPTAKQGYLKLPGKGEKWYDVNTTYFRRGVEGNWYRASAEFTSLMESWIAGANSGSQPQ